MEAPLVQMTSVWKKFRSGGHHDSLRDLVPAVLGRVFSKREAHELQRAEFWAVRDVSFKVGLADALGIIGSNGAGKSTILKLLTRILRPTTGTCAVNGRVGALIEIAAGFHPDLTGRENVFLQASIMGMPRADTLRRFDDIVDFAGVAEFIDTPIKRYSSGMNARLGFAIAAHLEPTVLIIDEVLSVGDAAFQARCLDRIRRLKRDGVGLVFVSHNLPAVESLCDRVLWLQKGQVKFMGEPRSAISQYLESTSQSTAVNTSGVDIAGREVSSPVTFESLTFVDDNRNPVREVPTGARLTLGYRLRCHDGEHEVIVGYAVCSLDGRMIFGENSAAAASPFEMIAGDGIEVEVTVDSLSIPEGDYYIYLSAENPLTGRVYDRFEKTAHFSVVTPNDVNRIGSIRLRTAYRIEKLETSRGPRPH